MTGSPEPGCCATGEHGSESGSPGWRQATTGPCTRSSPAHPQGRCTVPWMCLLPCSSTSDIAPSAHLPACLGCTLPPRGTNRASPMAEEPFKPFVGQEHLGLVRGSWGKLGQPQGDAHHHGAAAQLRAQPGWFSVAACSRNRGWELLQPPVPMRHAQLNFCNLFVLLPGIHYCSFMAPDDLDSENYLPTSLIMFGGVRVPCWEGTPLRGALVASTGGERGGGKQQGC